MDISQLSHLVWLGPCPWSHLQEQRPTQRSSNTGEAIIAIIRGSKNGQLKPEGCSEFRGPSGSRALGLSLMTPIHVTTSVCLCSLLPADFPFPSEAFANRGFLFPPDSSLCLFISAPPRLRAPATWLLPILFLLLLDFSSCMVYCGSLPSMGGGCCRALEEWGRGLSPSSPIFLSPSVLDLNAFERQNKAEGLGMVNEDGTGEALSWASVPWDILFLRDRPLTHIAQSSLPPRHPPSPMTIPKPNPLPHVVVPSPAPTFLQGLPPQGPHPWLSFRPVPPPHHHTDPALHMPQVSRPGCCSH